jgi:glycosyltransferase involved in cell wall biosynthesis
MVSVLIPSFNNAQWLTACIESCIAQQSLLHEIIVVDDHSTDGSFSVLKDLQQRYPVIIKLFTNPKKGANHARNYAFAQSTGKYIQWLDSDDFLLPGKFEAQIRSLEKSESDIAYSDWRMDFWSNGEKIDSDQKLYKDYSDFLLELIKDNWTSPNNYLVTKSFAQKLDGGIGWNPETKVGQDREYFTMAGILGAKFVYVPGMFAVYNKQESGTISGMDFKKRLELNQILEERFRVEIAKQDWFPKEKKLKYNAILDTHKLKACFYHPRLKISRWINPFKIEWQLMHWKMRIVMPCVWLRYHVKLLF